MRHNDVFFAGKRAIMTATDPDTGEVVLEMPIEPGRHPGNRFAELRASGLQLHLVGGVMCSPGGGLRTMAAPETTFETAANPDFQPSAEDTQLRRAELMAKRLKAQNDRAERIVKEAQALAVKTKASEPESPVVQDDEGKDDAPPDPTPKPKPRTKAEPKPEEADE